MELFHILVATVALYAAGGKPNRPYTAQRWFRLEVKMTLSGFSRSLSDGACSLRAHEGVQVQREQVPVPLDPSWASGTRGELSTCP